ncbi:MAG: hypothetical protein ACLSH6_08010 [Limosilactobacillus pontis]
MNKTFMSGYYQGVIEVAPASLSAAKVEELAVTMTIQHLRHAGVSITTIHDFRSMTSTPIPAWSIATLIAMPTSWRLLKPASWRGLAG